MKGKRGSVPFLFIFRDNILVLDIFFEALNYETIEQKKAYEVAGLLGTLKAPGLSRSATLAASGPVHGVGVLLQSEAWK